MWRGKSGGVGGGDRTWTTAAPLNSSQQLSSRNIRSSKNRTTNPQKYCIFLFKAETLVSKDELQLASLLASGWLAGYQAS